MLERFTGQARRVIALAQDEARLFRHNYVGTEHILLGLLREGRGVAAGALESFGVSLESARSGVEETVGLGTSPVKGTLPLTPRAKGVLELSMDEAVKLGHNYVGTEHILLGLLQEGDGASIGGMSPVAWWGLGPPLAEPPA